LKQLRKLRLVSEFVQGPHLHAKNGVVPGVHHPKPNFQAMPDFGNTAKRQECPLNSRDDVFIGKHLGPTLAGFAPYDGGLGYMRITPASVAQVTARGAGVTSDTSAADIITLRELGSS
jgi:hypothetical protein